MKYILNFKYCMRFIFMLCISITGCKKFVDVDPPVYSLTTGSAFSENTTAISVMTGHFAYLSSSDLGFFSLTGMSRFTGLSSDELELWNGISDPVKTAYYTNDLFSQEGQSAGGECWPYVELYACNTVLEGVTASNSLNQGVKKQLLGEARFMRALYFFYLVNLYGDVPLTLTTDVRINSALGRSPKADVYQQIIKDLKEAQTLLSADFLDAGLRKYLSTPERVRPTKWAASALLARTYLYSGDWINAEVESSTLIDNNAIFGLDPLNDVFKKNSREAIWQLQPVYAGFNTGDGGFYILTGTGPNEYTPVFLSNSQMNAFEQGDARQTNGNWVNSLDISGKTYYYPYKYKLGGFGATQGAEYIMMLRLGEQYLIRAEARAHLGNTSGAREDLLAIRRRAGLADETLKANDQTSLLGAVMHERQVELFTEWGHRWFDLKRTGNIDAVMSVVAPTKGGRWQSTDALYPIPFTDIQRNQNLKQNLGY